MCVWGRDARWDDTLLPMPRWIWLRLAAAAGFFARLNLPGLGKAGWVRSAPA